MRPPDFVLPGYLSRWYVWPRNRWCNLYLHRIEGSDTDRDLHDHPWWSMSICLAGTMREHMTTQRAPYYTILAWHHISRLIPRFLPIFRRPEHMHRLEIVRGPVWTLFLTGPHVRDWGFLTALGWVHHDKYVEEGDC